jgi:hypothetical protein
MERPRGQIEDSERRAFFSGDRARLSHDAIASAPLKGACTTQDCRDSPEQNVYIEPERPLLNILAVQINHVLEVKHLAPATDLPEAGNTRFRVEAPEVMILVVLKVRFEKRTGSNERHLANKDVEELRYFVEAPATQCPAKPSRARIVADLEQASIAGLIQMGQVRFLRIGPEAHRSELDHPETLSTKACSLLEKKRRPWGVETYGDGYEDQQR